MSLLRNIRSWFGHFEVRREMKTVDVERKTVSFMTAKKIGFLYDATEDKNYEIMKQYLKTIRSQQKEVQALGYVDQKQLPSNKFAQYGLDFFCKKDLNWKGVPANKIINNFIKEDFDIVVNLTDNHVFPLCYIAAVSRAKFRVGKFNRHFINCYDMMIQSENNNLQHFIVETERYLKNLNV